MYKLFSMLQQFFLAVLVVMPCAILPPRALAKQNSEANYDLASDLQYYKNVQRLEAQFKQTKTLTNLGIDLVSTGSFTLEKSEHPQVTWQMDTPAFIKFVITPSSIVSFDQPNQKEGKTLLDNQSVATRMLRPIFAWLSMDSQQIKQDFIVHKLHADQFTLTAKDAASATIAKITMQLGKDKLLKNLTLLEKSKDKITISFFNTKVFKR
jgi:hypothetical protein